MRRGQATPTSAPRVPAGVTSWHALAATPSPVEQGRPELREAGGWSSGPGR